MYYLNKDERSKHACLVMAARFSPSPSLLQSSLLRPELINTIWTSIVTSIPFKSLLQCLLHHCHLKEIILCLDLCTASIYVFISSLLCKSDVVTYFAFDQRDGVLFLSKPIDYSLLISFWTFWTTSIIQNL